MPKATKIIKANPLAKRNPMAAALATSLFRNRIKPGRRKDGPSVKEWN